MTPAPVNTPAISTRVLDPASRISEVLFGLIMALTFTGSLSAASAGREEVRTMLFGAIGCNIAWSLVDAVMHLLSRLTERGRDLVTLRALRASPNPEHARAFLADALPPVVAATLPQAELDAIVARLRQLPEPPSRPHLSRRDLAGALAIFLLVVISTFPVVVPFILMPDALPALRVSNVIAVVMLFFCGHRLGRYSGTRAWLLGLTMAIIGSILAGLTIALGG